MVNKYELQFISGRQYYHKNIESLEEAIHMEYVLLNEPSYKARYHLHIVVLSPFTEY